MSLEITIFPHGKSLELSEEIGNKNVLANACTELPF